MVYLLRSHIDARVIEIREGQVVLQEIEILFPIRIFPTSFSSLEDALDWLAGIEVKLAKAKAYRLLAMRAYPSIVLLRKLEEKGFSKRVGEKIIEELTSLGYLQDDEFWVHLIQREWKRGYGPRYLEWKKKVPKAHLSLHFTEAMQRQKIRELAKKFSSPKKAVQTLVRRGFDVDCIRKEVDLFP